MAVLLMFSLYFYPRSPCGERPSTKYPVILGRGISIHALLAESDFYPLKTLIILSISIHALLAESDVLREPTTDTSNKFLSTLSLRRATGKHVQQPTQQEFLSTLSLRRATGRHRANDRSPVHFYPRSPCGERQIGQKRLRQKLADFYPRSPCGERRKITITVDEGTLISIHALLAESDSR